MLGTLLGVATFTKRVYSSSSARPRGPSRAQPFGCWGQGLGGSRAPGDQASQALRELSLSGPVQALHAAQLSAVFVRSRAQPSSSECGSEGPRLGLFTANQETAGNAGDAGSIPGSGRSPGGGCGDPLQCSWLENPMDRGAWRATVHGGHKESGTSEHTRAGTDQENRFQREACPASMAQTRGVSAALGPQP